MQLGAFAIDDCGIFKFIGGKVDRVFSFCSKLPSESHVHYIPVYLLICNILTMRLVLLTIGGEVLRERTS